MNNTNLQQVLKLIKTLTPSEAKIVLEQLTPPQANTLHLSLFKALSMHKSNHALVCPHCGCINAKRNGTKNGNQRYLCLDCNRSFINTTNSIFYHTRKSDENKWIEFIECMIDNLSLRKSADKCSITLKTAFNWRHKILNSINKLFANDKITGLIEMDDTYFGLNYKGNHSKSKNDFVLPRKAKVRGKVESKRGTSKNQVAVSTAISRNGELLCNLISYGSPTVKELHRIYDNKIINPQQSKIIIDGWKPYITFCNENRIVYKRLVMQNRHPGDKTPVVRGQYHLQHVNNFHSIIKDVVMNKYKGVATKHLETYINWCKWLKLNKDVSYQKMINSLIKQCVSIDISIKNEEISNKVIW